ncbi:hypothetical protein KEM54_005513 [Ascosphaera aggregata]|nr:hypothetical protein KEM54_005513 [Ascosphaera aggregata]
MTFVSPSLQRSTTIIAATLIALASGTNVPRISADKLSASHIDYHLKGTAANLGMYATGALTGKFTDSRGPRPSGFIGALCIALGYFPLQRAATNFPRHRGTATAFPLAAYGLSAFFFSSISAIAFHDDTGSFLMLLATAPGAIALISTFFIQTFPVSSSSYKSIPAEERPHHATRLSITRGGHTETDVEAGNPSTSMVVDNSKSTTATASSTKADSDGVITDTAPATATAKAEPGPEAAAKDGNAMAVDETSSLMSGRNSTCSDSSDIMPPTASHHHSLYTDVRGWELLKKVEFWQLVALLGLLSGIGLMTIK